MDLTRIPWLATVLVLLVAVLVLILQGYLGYAGVTLAVAVCAALPSEAWPSSWFVTLAARW